MQMIEMKNGFHLFHYSPLVAKKIPSTSKRPAWLIKNERCCSSHGIEFSETLHKQYRNRDESQPIYEKKINHNHLISSLQGSQFRAK